MDASLEPVLTEQEKLERIVNEYAKGKFGILALCEMYGLDYSVFCARRITDSILARAYIGARLARADVLFDDITAIADTERDPNRARIQTDARKFVVSRLNRREYGEQIDVTLTEKIDLAGALSESKARALRVLHPVLIENSQVTYNALSDIVDINKPTT